MAMYSSFWCKCLMLRCHDFSALADYLQDVVQFGKTTKCHHQVKSFSAKPECPSATELAACGRDGHGFEP